MVFMKHCSPNHMLSIRMVLFFKTRVILSLKLLAILLIILYKLTKFEAPSYNNFWDNLITSFQCPNLQRAIAKKKTFFFEKVYQVIYSSPFISWPSLKLLPIKVFEIYLLKVFNYQIWKGQWLKKGNNSKK